MTELHAERSTSRHPTWDRIGRVVSVAAIAVLLLAVCALPWIHGGRVPLARLVLQIGMVTAAVASMAGRLISGKRDELLPTVIVPLAVLAIVGTIQLLPVHKPIVSQMDHAVHPELQNAVDLPPIGDRAALTPSPSDTRLLLAQATAMIVLCWVTFDVIRSRKATLVCLSVLAGNAALNSILALLQLFSGNRFLIREEWWLGYGNPFSTFVNPNGASGWLCLGLAAATGLVVYQFTSPSPAIEVPGQSSVVRALQDFIHGLITYFARLNVYHVLAWVAFGFIGATIAATRSRGGISAAIAGIVVVAVGRVSIRRLPATVLAVLAGTAAICGLLVLFNLDAGILKELRTLHDPLTEAGSRFAHWGDSLVLLQDFPFLGSGLGAYKYATLPYQQHVTQSWFQNADCQFVEALVEGGFIGFLAFVSVGAFGLAHGLMLYRHGLGRQFSSDGSHSRIKPAVGAAVLLAITSQIVAGMFDFGLGLPPAATCVVLLTALASRTLAGPGSDRPGSSGRRRSSGRSFSAHGKVPWHLALRLTPNSLVAVKLALIVAAGSFIPDLWAATQVDRVAVEALHHLNAPLTAQVLQQRADVSQRLTNAIKLRSDDSYAHWIRVSLAEDALRRRMLNSAVSVSDTSEEELQTAFEHTSAGSLALRLFGLSEQGLAAQAGELREFVQSAIGNSHVLGQLEGLKRKFPLMPRVAERLAVWQMFGTSPDDAARTVAAAQFVEPTEMQMLFRLGYVAVHTGHAQLGLELWQSAVDRSETLRATVLAEAANHMSVSDSLAQFGPKSYIDTVAALRRVRQPDLKTLLLQQAEDAWVEPADDPGRPVMDSRIAHLQSLKDAALLEEWLGKCLTWTPNDPDFLATLASVLESRGELVKSVETWRRVQFQVPDHRLAARAIKRLEAKMQTEKPK